MSGWQQYVDNLMKWGVLASAALLDNTNGVVWAQTADFPVVRPHEAATLARNFSNPSIPQDNGIGVGEQRFVCIKADERSVYGKSTNGGVITVKTKRAIIVGIVASGKPPGSVAKVVEDMADYLISLGY
ncbi:Pfy1 profilin [Pelomyxa schiedti]|nr:Pfy1 profilin [Pelomyxa schiedti]